MTRDDDPRDELLRRLEVMVSGAGLDDLRQLVGELSLLGGRASQNVPQSQSAELGGGKLARPQLFPSWVDPEGALAGAETLVLRSKSPVKTLSLSCPTCASSAGG